MQPGPFVPSSATLPRPMPPGPPSLVSSSRPPFTQATQSRGKRDAGPGRAVDLPCRLSREFASIFLDVPIRALEGIRRDRRPICEARHVAMYLAHVAFQLRLEDVARFFGRDRTSVGYAVRRVEDRRDDAAFDALLTRIEDLAGALRESMGRDRP